MSATTAEVGGLGGAGGRARRRFRWSTLLWALVCPRRARRLSMTMSGGVLGTLAVGVGFAAYNSSNNILFIVLALMMACLVFSGLLAWINLRRVCWRLRLSAPLRAGHDAVVTVELRNNKRLLPTHCLWFELSGRAVAEEGGWRAESTVIATGREVREALARREDVVRGHAVLAGGLAAQGEARVEWIVRPERRGRYRVKLDGVGSDFPFGLLRKDVGTDLAAETVVWPAPVDYRWHGGASWRVAGGERVPKAGSGGDLFALRRYLPGDSHRLVHWKASARTRTLLVRQFTAESAEGYAMWLRTGGGEWTRPEQFELLIGFVAALAEDLFRAGRLREVAIDAEPPMPVRRVRDLEALLDRLAVARPAEMALAAGGGRAGRRNVMTFSPEGARGVAAHVNGQLAASA